MPEEEVITYKICDMPHEDEVEASGSVVFMLNGYRYRMDLCPEHEAQLEAAVEMFGAHAYLVSEPTPLERRRDARPITLPGAAAVPTRPSVAPTRRPERPPVAAELRRQQAMQREPLPPSAERWWLNRHAQQRLRERELDLYEVLMTAERPEKDSRPTRQYTDNPDVRERIRGDYKVVVNTRKHEVLTAARLSMSLYEQFPPTKKASA